MNSLNMRNKLINEEVTQSDYLSNTNVIKKLLIDSTPTKKDVTIFADILVMDTIHFAIHATYRICLYDFSIS